MGRPLLDMRGQVFHRLTVLERVGLSGGSSNWRCQCECGNITDVQRGALINGTVKSCGCLRRARMERLELTHGKSKTPEYKAWDSLKQRCTNPADKDFANYGGRGIAVCAEWLNNFEAFLGHVGFRPSPQHSIDRIKNDCGYEPWNVHWTTRTQQGRNKRNNRLVEVNGIMMPISAAVEIVGLRKHVILKRLNSGWSVRDALWTPLDMRKSHVNCS